MTTIIYLRKARLSQKFESFCGRYDSGSLRASLLPDKRARLRPPRWLTGNNEDPVKRSGPEDQCQSSKRVFISLGSLGPGYHQSFQLRRITNRDIECAAMALNPHIPVSSFSRQREIFLGRIRYLRQVK